MLGNKGVRFRLFVIVSMILTVFVAVIILFAWFMPRYELRTRTNTAVINTLEQIGKNANVCINSNRRYIYAMKNSKDFKEHLLAFDSEQDYVARNELVLWMQRYLLNLSYKDENISALWLYGKDRMIYSLGGVSAAPNELFQEEWYQKTMDLQGGIFAQGGYKNPIINSSVDKAFIIGNAIYMSDTYSELTVPEEEAEWLGSVFIIMDNSKFHQIYDEMQSDSLGTITILDGKNRVISGECPPGLEEIDFSSYADKTQGVASEMLGGEKSLIFYYTVPGGDLRIVNTVTEKEYFSDTSSLSRILILVTLLFYVIMLLVTVRLTKQIAAPIQMLYAAIRGVRGEKDGKNEIEGIAKEVEVMQRQLKSFVDTEVELEREKNQLELRALQYQINPHFLNNILSSIRFKVLKNNDLESAKVLETLAKFMRRTITKAGSMVTLREEINNIRDMAYIYSVQYECELQVVYQITEEQKKIKIPNMILQPLAENAFVHGAGANPQDTVIVLSCEQTEEETILSVSDNGVGIRPEQKEELIQSLEGINKTHVGLYNVKQRLKLHYGEKSSFYVDGDENGFCVKIVLRG